MRITFSTATVMLALCALAALPAATPALASTGGVSAPTPATGASATPATGTSAPPATGTSRAKVRPSGIATWFGPGFYGSETACGQTLTPAVIGVANRTLPCGTLVKFGYKGHTLTLPVLDRGPYAHHADWDLTAGAAQALGVTETVRITTVVVGAVPNTPSLGLPATPPAATIAGGASAG